MMNAVLANDSTPPVRAICDEEWNAYARDGVLRLGCVADHAELEALRQRADDLALGRIVNPAVEMQLDTGGAYEDLPDTVARFDQGTLRYRKIQGLENDDLYRRLIRHARFREVAAHVYGAHAPVSIFRAMIMNKPAEHGTHLPWHQDGGDVWKLDHDPLVTIWVAIDDATIESGCMDVVPGSHRHGILSMFGSTVCEEDVARHCTADRIAPLEVPAGHAVLLHNWVIHRSGLNHTGRPRRAFTMVCMDGRTRSTLTGQPFPMIWGDPPEGEHPYAEQLRLERDALAARFREAERYALSLRDENAALHASRAEAETYARSLEAELEKQRAAAARPRRRWWPWR